ncbi:MAG: ribonuclease P protein component [Endozoicomonas sp. (ex Botrylloides leachii)]|nr:ribonuclease P protein component [Endozoicomonas sp. (ex Botrylloides leachii)]
MDFAFPRDRRLCSSAEFKQVFEKTDIKISYKQLLLLARANNQEGARLGIIVAKKNIRLSVNRNRAKRRIRESFRLNHTALGCLDMVVLARKGFGELDDSEINQLLAKLWLKLCQRLEVRKNL